MPELDWTTFAGRYCDRQDQTPDGLLAVLRGQRDRFAPDGWMLLECAEMSSRMLGSLAILPFGPRNTFTAVPDRPISPRGLASDISCVVGVLPAAALPQ